MDTTIHLEAKVARLEELVKLKDEQQVSNPLIQIFNYKITSLLKITHFFLRKENIGR
jgi:hypothetical protein